MEHVDGPCSDFGHDDEPVAPAGLRTVAAKKAAAKNVATAQRYRDDGQVDLMMRRGNRTYYQYLKLTNGFLYGAGSRDLGNAPGPVQDIAQR